MEEGYEDIKKQLSAFIPEDLVSDLLGSYFQAKKHFLRHDFSSSLNQVGKFIENALRIIHFLVYGEKLDEIRNVKKEVERLERNPASQVPSSISQAEEVLRLIIPRIAYVAYTLRSKRGAVHVKPVSPTYIDATLAISICDWILAEFIRLLSEMPAEKVEELLHRIVRRDLPIIQQFSEKDMVVLRNMGCKYEILVLLFKKGQEGLTRREIGKLTKQYYSSSTVTNALRELVDERCVYRTSDDRFIITHRGEEVLLSTYKDIIRSES